MARKNQTYVKGPFTHRRTETDYMAALLEAVPLEEWHGSIISVMIALTKKLQ